MKLAFFFVDRELEMKVGGHITTKKEKNNFFV